MNQSARMNSETPVSNRTVHEIELSNRHKMHLQRLHEIRVAGKRRGDLGNLWRTGPQRSRPTYPHLRDNLKKQQLESERFDAIEHENRLLLEKMSALMASGSVLDPTQGTWEFQPGVRLNRFQMPVIDHAVSHQPPMPQRGAAKEPESLNWGARRRELERITAENRGIVHRIQGRSSYYPASQWGARSEEHDKHLLLIRRPNTSPPPALPMPPSPLVASTRQQHRRGHVRRARGPGATVSSLLAEAKVGDAYLLIGGIPDVTPGCTLIVQPRDTPLAATLMDGPAYAVPPAGGEAVEERCVVHETVLRSDGLVVLLREAVCKPHPIAARVILEV